MGDAERACSRDGGGPIEVSPFPIPAELQGKFQGLEPFAQSPHSAAYLATQPSSGFRGLLKVIPLRDLDASERGRLKRELRKQVKLAHPNLPRIVDGGELSTDLWLLRDHVDGESLGQRLKREGRLELPDALAVLAQVASALDELHRAGILHRDVRPSRIVLSPREQVPIVKLLDAGIAARQRTGTVFDRLGTPAYMSPEQIAGKLVSFRSDLYALGCVFYEMLTGRTPFGLGETPDALRGLLDAHQNEPPPPISMELPPAISALLASLLDKEPRKRPFSAQQVRRTLEPHLPPGMPVITPARSSVAGAASPVAATGRRSAPSRPSNPPPGLLPPRRGSRPTPPDPMAAGDLTEELEVEDITTATETSLAPPDPGFRERTMEIPGEELAGLRLDPSVAPPARPDSVPVLVSVPAPAPVPAPVPVDEPDDSATTRLDADSAKALLGTLPDKSASAPPPPADPAPAAQAAAAPRRPSVAFDVESLFNDPQEEPAPVVSPPKHATPAGSAAAEDVAPTLLYQKRDDAAHAAYQQALTDAEATANQDRTVVTRIPTQSGFRNKLIAGASVLAAVILLFAMCRGGDDDEAPAAEAPPPTRGDSVPAANNQGTAEHVVTPAAPAKAAEPVAAAEPAAQEAAPAEPTAAPEPAPAEPAAAEPATAATGTTNTATAPAAEGPSAPARKNAPDAVVGQKASRAERVARAEKHKAEARAHYQAGRFKDAARSYELATRETPSDGGAFAGLGASLLAANDPEGAIRAYQRAVQIDGKSSGFHAALGRAYAMKGDRARAKTAYTRALALNPKNGAAKQGLEKLQ